MRPSPQETTDMVTFTEQMLNGKLHLWCSESSQRKIIKNGLYQRYVPVKFQQLLKVFVILSLYLRPSSKNLTAQSQQ